MGGAVRDRLLGRPIKDCDWVVVGGSADELELQGFKRVGKGFPVFLHPETHEEYALARKERKTGAGYKGFAFDASPDVSLVDDLRRRDITINAMAEDESGNVIDPYGGQRDLAQGILRHVSPAFVEDPVRVLRVARFAARYDFTVAPETLALMRELTSSGETENLVAERVWTEFDRALSEPAPRRFFEVLRDCSALAVIFPELDALFGVPQPPAHHPEIDTGLHTLMVLDAASRLSPDPMVRFAALVHDLGKACTPREEWPKHVGHEQRGAEIVNKFCDRHKVPKTYRELAVLVARQHLTAHRALTLRPGTVYKLLKACDALRRPARFDRFLLACEADVKGRMGQQHCSYPAGTFLRAALQAAAGIDVRALLNGTHATQLSEQRIESARIRAISEIGREQYAEPTPMQY